MNINATIHIHLDNPAASAAVQERLDLLLQTMNRVTTQETDISAMISATETAILARLNTATNDIAAKLVALAAANQDDPELNAALTGIADRLTGLAADPTNPVPEETPAPTPEPTPEPPAA